MMFHVDIDRVYAASIYIYIYIYEMYVYTIILAKPVGGFF